jgi:type VI secretion system protein ImpK
MADFDDPFLPSDPNQRPRPGGGRRGGAEPPFVRTITRPVEPEPLPAETRALLGMGFNPLVQAATPLLLLTGQLRGLPSAMDVAGLRRHALEEIRRFEDQARAAGVRSEIVLAARYALCSGLDEAVLSTPWGAHSEWAEHPLLVALHREAWGGEKFFEMLNRISADPARHIDLIELQYIELALGFSGKYQMLERGYDQLADLQRKLYRTIREQRGAAPSELSLRWRGLEDRRNRLIRYVPWWVVGAAALAVLAVTFGFFYARLADQAEPIQTTLGLVGTGDFSAPPPPAVPSRPTLKSLLRAQIDRGALSVEEEGARTVVTLRGGDVFESASAAVNPSYEDTLQQVAAAMNQVPGRVLVEGHTDNQPIKSFAFGSNAELSLARARSVSDVLKRTLDGTTSVTFTGMGDRQPKYRPESTPENRARNRRVEIIHISGA